MSVHLRSELLLLFFSFMPTSAFCGVLYSQVGDYKDRYDANRCMKSGVDEMNAGHNTAAVDDFNRALERTPQTHRGVIELELGHPDAAASNFRDALSIAQKGGAAASQVAYIHIYLWVAESLRQSRDANAELANYRASAPSKAWWGEVIDYLLGRVTDEELMRKASSSSSRDDQDQHCEAFFYTGLKAQMNGQANRAKEDFRRCVATRDAGFYEYLLSQKALKASP